MTSTTTTSVGSSRKKCCVGGCDSTSTTDNLFCIPINDKLRSLWLSFLVPTNPLLLGLSKNQLLSKRVCHKHFESWQFDFYGRRIRDSYPTLFTKQEIEEGVPLSSEEYNVLNEHNYYQEYDDSDIENEIQINTGEEPSDHCYLFTGKKNDSTQDKTRPQDSDQEIRPNDTRQEDTTRPNETRQDTTRPNETRLDTTRPKESESEEDSELWTFFDKVDKSKAKCSMCEHTVLQESTVMFEHLKAIHPVIYQTLQDGADDIEYEDVDYLTLDSEENIDNESNEENSNIEIVQQNNTIFYAKHDAPIENSAEEIVQIVPNCEEQENLLTESNLIRVNENVINESEGNYTIELLLDENVQSLWLDSQNENKRNEEIDTFSKYIAGLLKQVPLNKRGKVQSDIINLIINETNGKLDMNIEVNVNAANVDNVADKDIINGTNETPEDQAILKLISMNENQVPKSTQQRKRRKISFKEEFRDSDDNLIVENFGRYISCLLQTIPHKHVRTKLQAEIIKIITTTRAKSTGNRILTFEGTIEYQPES